MFTLASGLHEILEVQNQGKGKVDGVKLRETIQRKGFADGITGPITFRSQIPDRETIRMDYVVFNFQQDGFSRGGSIGTVNASSFKNCDQYQKYYGSDSLKDECKAIVFRGLCSNLDRRLSQLYSRMRYIFCLPLPF